MISFVFGLGIIETSSVAARANPPNGLHPSAKLYFACCSIGLDQCVCNAQRHGRFSNQPEAPSQTNLDESLDLPPVESRCGDNSKAALGAGSRRPPYGELNIAAKQGEE